MPGNLPNGIAAIEHCGLLVTPELIDRINEAIGKLAVSVTASDGLLYTNTSPGHTHVSLASEQNLDDDT